MFRSCQSICVIIGTVDVSLRPLQAFTGAMFRCLALVYNKASVITGLSVQSALLHQIKQNVRHNIFSLDRNPCHVLGHGMLKKLAWDTVGDIRWQHP